VFSRFTGRTVPPTSPAREAWLPVGRRGGKSRFAALAVFMACFRDYRPHLKPGEHAIVMVLAAGPGPALVPGLRDGGRREIARLITTGYAGFNDGPCDGH